jgi:hypothetical protein
VAAPYHERRPQLLAKPKDPSFPDAPIHIHDGIYTTRPVRMQFTLRHDKGRRHLN